MIFTKNPAKTLFLYGDSFIFLPGVITPATDTASLRDLADMLFHYLFPDLGFGF